MQLFRTRQTKKDRFDRWIKSSKNADLERRKSRRCSREFASARGRQKKKERKKEKKKWSRVRAKKNVSSRRFPAGFSKEKENYAGITVGVVVAIIDEPRAIPFRAFCKLHTPFTLAVYAESTADTRFSLYLGGTLFRGTIAVVAGGSVCIVVVAFLARHCRLCPRASAPICNTL